MKKGKNISCESVKKKLINGNEEKQKETKGWTNIADLENQYKRAKNTLTRKIIGKLIDVYEKQVKALNIRTHQNNKNRNKMKSKSIPSMKKMKMKAQMMVNQL